MQAAEKWPLHDTCVLVQHPAATDMMGAFQNVYTPHMLLLCSLVFSACFTRQRIDNDAAARRPAARKGGLAALMMCRLISQKCFMAHKIRANKRQASERRAPAGPVALLNFLLGTWIAPETRKSIMKQQHFLLLQREVKN